MGCVIHLFFVFASLTSVGAFLTQTHGAALSYRLALQLHGFHRGAGDNHNGGILLQIVMTRVLIQ